MSSWFIKYYQVCASKIKPNYMQKKALKELNRYRAIGVNRALIVVSAGSGKTYFDIHMDKTLPEYLQYDFGLTNDNQSGSCRCVID